MKVTILGSGTSTGVPMVGCICRTCTSGDQRDKRTRASLLIRHNGRNILFDTSTDFRRQALRESLKRVDAVLFTHSHADHMNGIDDLRGFHFLHREIIPCFASRKTMDTLLNRFGYIFTVQEDTGYTPLLFPNVIEGTFELFGLSVTPVPLEHGNTSVLGYRIGSFAYLTDCSAIPESSFQLLDGVEVLVMDGLRWRPHPFHFNISSALGAIERISPRRAILTHLSHDVMYAEGGVLPSGIEFAYDGLTFEL